MSGTGGYQLNVTRAEQWAGLTPEDAAILERSFELPSVLLEADNIDARVMMAREVFAETAWRVNSVKVTPAACVQSELNYNGETLRERMERQCGEVLA